MLLLGTLIDCVFVVNSLFRIISLILRCVLKGMYIISPVRVLEDYVPINLVIRLLGIATQKNGNRIVLITTIAGSTIPSKAHGVGEDPTEGRSFSLHRTKTELLPLPGFGNKDHRF